MTILKKLCQKNKKIKRADKILPEVYGTILRRLVAAKPYTPVALFEKKSLSLFFFHILEENYRKERKN